MTRLRGVLCIAVLSLAGCTVGENGGGGEGPGHRAQALALKPDQELKLGQEAYQEVLSKSHVVRSGPEVERVRTIGRKIAEASANEPLQREINLRLKGYTFDWEFNVLQDPHVNAFCLPGGKVAVFSGLLPVAANDDQLATVMSHEIAHALAHHSSERIAQQQKHQLIEKVLATGIGALDPEHRQQVAGVLSAGAQLGSLPYERQQESEADHIGLFLMTFAGYNPDEAVHFWERMGQRSGGGHTPEIFSDHPSDAKRIAQMRAWAPQAKAAKKAYDAGRVAPAR